MTRNFNITVMVIDLKKGKRKMKKYHNIIKIFAVAAFLSCTMLTGTVNAAQTANEKSISDELEINKENFSTKNLRKQAKKWDLNKDGKLSMEEGSKVTKVVDTYPVPGIKVKSYSTEFLKWLPNLEELRLRGISIKQIDLSDNKRLKTLVLDFCELKTLDVSCLKNLITLECGFSEINHINLKNLKKLESLGISYNPIKKLNYSGENLKALYCSGCGLKNLNLKKMKKLKKLYCNNNQLKKLNVSNNKKLKYLYCEENQLKQLNVKNLKKLDWFSCKGNQIKELDVSKNPDLKFLYIENNGMKKLIVSQNLYDNVYEAGLADYDMLNIKDIMQVAN